MAPVTRAMGKQGPLLDEDGGSAPPASRSVAPILRRSLQARGRRLRLRPQAPCGGRSALGTSSDLMAPSNCAQCRVDEERLLKADEHIAALTASLAAEKASLAAEKAARIQAEEDAAAAMQRLVSVEEIVYKANECVTNVKESMGRYVDQVDADSILGRSWTKLLAENSEGQYSDLGRLWANSDLGRIWAKKISEIKQ